MFVLAITLIGAAAGIALAGALRGAAPRTDPDGPAGVPVDLRRRRLAEGLLRRLGAPVLDRALQVGHRFTPGSRGAALRHRLDNAGVTATVEEFLSAKTVCAGAGLVLALGWALVTGPDVARLVIGGALGALGGFFVPDALVSRRGRARQEDIARTLPDALDLLALTVQAGLGLEQGVAEVTAELPGPLGDELDRMRKEQQLGRSRREALEALHARNRSEDLRTFVDALLHAERLGASVGDTLKVQARELRRKRRARARELAGKAPVKLLFPLVLGIFPAMFVVVLGPGAIRIAQALLSR